MHPADHPGPLVFVDDLDAPTLAEDDRHHLSRVLRLRDGDPLTLADGAGGWRPARFGERPDPTGDVVHQSAPRPALTVGFALVKGDKPELIVQKLTELGIDRVVPFRAERSVVRWDADRAARAVERLRSVARAAAMQCHRPWLPEIAEVADLAELAAEPGVAFAERGAPPPSLDHPVVLVGPEGGWSTAERDLAAASVGLADLVLRAETAALTAGVLLTALRARRLPGPGG